ncbi:MAG: ATP-binding protein [Vicinamibacterales bacterium]
MKQWFSRRPIHQKLVVLALVVTTAALTLAIGGLVAIDMWSYRQAVANDTQALATVIAETSAAAVVFDDPDEAEQSLATVRVRPTITRACLYLPDGRLFAAFARAPDQACPPVPPEVRQWTTVSALVPVTRNERVLGLVYVERELSELQARVVVAVVMGTVMLLLAAGLALAMASRLHRSISEPIARLAGAARRMGAEARPQAPPLVDPGDPNDPMDAKEPRDPGAIGPGMDEIGDLVRAFSDLLRRIADANEELRRKEAERAQLLVLEREASRLKDEFLATVSHELRTPLNAIIGWIQILTTTQVNPDVLSRGLASIGRNARAQIRVIEDLMDVSRIITGKLSLRFEPTDLRDAVDAAADVIRPAAEAKGIRLSVQLTPVPCPVNGDRDRLQQVVWNLLSNAVKFTDPGGTIALSLREEPGAYEIEVADTGVGIPPAFLPFAFDRFRQADGSVTREHGGLGLGLAIVKEITTLHGGAVSVHGHGDRPGTTFRVRLPALHRERGQAEDLPHPSSSPRLDGPDTAPGSGVGCTAPLEMRAIEPTRGPAQAPGVTRVHRNGQMKV